MARNVRKKELLNTRLANQYGGWIYCEGCSKAIGYLCYSTYDKFEFEYNCRCGNNGSILLELEDYEKSQANGEELILIKNRLCCYNDKSPLVSIISKNLNKYKYEIVCNKCKNNYKKEVNQNENIINAFNWYRGRNN